MPYVIGTKEYNMTHTLAGGMTGAHGGSVGSTAGGNVGKTDYTTGNQGSLKQKIKEKIPGTTRSDLRLVPIGETTSLYTRRQDAHDLFVG